MKLASSRLLKNLFSPSFTITFRSSGSGNSLSLRPTAKAKHLAYYCIIKLDFIRQHVMNISPLMLKQVLSLFTSLSRHFLENFNIIPTVHCRPI